MGWCWSRSRRKPKVMLWTARLKLRPWQECHREPFADLHADPDVMADLGGPFDRETADRKFDRYQVAREIYGFSRWAVEDRSGLFVGYAGIMFRSDETHPLGAHHEIGWRFRRTVWSLGYATESARAALDDAHRSCRISEILSYTSAENHRSQAVMLRLGLRAGFKSLSSVAVLCGSSHDHADGRDLGPCG
jgi:RimJ/RimL family protein N-acetyltransferase